MWHVTTNHEKAITCFVSQAIKFIAILTYFKWCPIIMNWGSEWIHIKNENHHIFMTIYFFLNISFFLIGMLSTGNISSSLPAHITRHLDTSIPDHLLIKQTAPHCPETFCEFINPKCNYFLISAQILSKLCRYPWEGEEAWCSRTCDSSKDSRTNWKWNSCWKCHRVDHIKPGGTGKSGRDVETPAENNTRNLKFKLERKGNEWVAGKVF